MIRQDGFSGADDTKYDPSSKKKLEGEKDRENIYTDGQTSAKFVLTDADSDEPVIENRKKKKRKVTYSRKSKPILPLDAYSLAWLIFNSFGEAITIEEMLSISPLSNILRHLPKHMTISRGNFDRSFKISYAASTIFDDLRCAIYMTYTHLLPPFCYINSGFDHRTKPKIITALIINFINKLAREFRFPSDITTAISTLVIHFFKSSYLYEDTGKKRLHIFIYIPFRRSLYIAVFGYLQWSLVVYCPDKHRLWI